MSKRKVKKREARPRLDPGESIKKFWRGLSRHKKYLIGSLGLWPFVTMIALNELSFRAFYVGLLGDVLIISAYFLGRMDPE